MRDDPLAASDRAAMKYGSPNPDFLDLRDADRIWFARRAGIVPDLASKLYRWEGNPAVEAEYRTGLKEYLAAWRTTEDNKASLGEVVAAFWREWSDGDGPKAAYLLHLAMRRSAQDKEDGAYCSALKDYTEHMLRVLAGGGLTAFLLCPEPRDIPAERWQRFLPVITAAEAEANYARYLVEVGSWQAPPLTDAQLEALAHPVEWEAYQRDKAAGDGNAYGRLVGMLFYRQPAVEATARLDEQHRAVSGAYEWRTEDAEPDPHGFLIRRAGLKAKSDGKGGGRSHPFVRVADFAVLLEARFGGGKATTEKPAQAELPKNKGGRLPSVHREPYRQALHAVLDEEGEAMRDADTGPRSDADIRRSARDRYAHQHDEEWERRQLRFVRNERLGSMKPPN